MVRALSDACIRRQIEAAPLSELLKLVLVHTCHHHNRQLHANPKPTQTNFPQTQRTLLFQQTLSPSTRNPLLLIHSEINASSRTPNRFALPSNHLTHPTSNLSLAHNPEQQPRTRNPNHLPYTPSSAPIRQQPTKCQTLTDVVRALTSGAERWHLSAVRPSPHKQAPLPRRHHHHVPPHNRCCVQINRPFKSPTANHVRDARGS